MKLAKKTATPANEPATRLGSPPRAVAGPCSDEEPVSGSTTSRTSLRVARSTVLLLARDSIVAFDLVKELKRRVGLPVTLHTHDTAGLGAAAYLAAIDAGLIEKIQPTIVHTYRKRRDALCAAMREFRRQEKSVRRIEFPIGTIFQFLRNNPGKTDSTQGTLTPGGVA